MNPHFYIYCLFATLLTGCSTTSVFNPKENVSSFDQTRNVYIMPHGNISNGFLDLELTGIGAHWFETSPNEITLIITLYNSWTSITGAELNIDGEIIALKDKGNHTDFEGGYSNGVSMMKMSNHDFVVKKDLVYSILESERAWLRVHTLSGVFENGIIDREKDSKAYHALKEFIAMVDNKPPI